MQVLRMENSNNHGPFSPDTFSNANSFQEAYNQAKDMWQHVPWVSLDIFGLHSDDVDHPHHLADVLGADDETTFRHEYLHKPLIEGNWTVGVKDIPQFLHWFPPQSLKDFARHGMKLDVYDVPDSAVKQGKWQLMFDPTKARLVRSEPLTMLLHAGKAN